MIYLSVEVVVRLVANTGPSKNKRTQKKTISFNKQDDYRRTICGAVARQKMRNLANLCDGPTPGGENNLKASSRNRAPISCPVWPYNKASLQHRYAIHNIRQHVLDLEPTSIPDPHAGPLRRRTWRG